MSRKKHKHRKSVPAQLPPPELMELVAIVERTQSGALSAEQHAKLKTAITTLAFLMEELRKKQASLARLRRMLFGAPTEKTRAVIEAHSPQSTTSPNRAGENEADLRAKAPGHGRHGAAAYTGADKVSVPHPALQGGQACPGCEKGRVYAMAESSVLVRITGVAPLGATLYECDRLRCNLCGEIYTAPAPEGVGTQKYDATATSMIGLLKYGTGLPFNRIETLQAGMRIPLPAATQWDLVRAGAEDLAPAHEALIRHAAQGTVLYNDDTTMKVLQLTREQRAAALSDEVSEQRTGVFTSGIVATRDAQKIALFFTGARHAGENLGALLARRAAQLPAPIQMCDALSSNTANDFDTLLASCLSHSRRKYVELAESFPEEVRFVLQTLREVYKTDAQAHREGLDPQARLLRHQAESGPRMEVLARWMRAQLDERRVEPNSSLGEAIRYMQSHWTELTLFLRTPEAPLDNNVCERALKKAILHRKNALFYKTLNGARVGDIFMSLIHTAELNHVAPFEYLVSLQRHVDAVRANPDEWMPWNYAATLARYTAGAGPPG
ncbi:MAG TPA: IS66 family transposase [Steroidobacteraceae bacterium]|nr:IS66 family transposase [Steroidobacteraceae bacterium]